MSYIVKGRDMPKNCSECPCIASNFMFCRVAAKPIPSIGHPEFCPLVEIPPHGRLIDADALEEEPCDLIDDRGLEAESGYSHDQIRNAPTIIEAEEGE